MNSRSRFAAGVFAAAVWAASTSAYAAADLAAAKAEGKVVWYTSAPIKQAQQLVKMFEAKTGISVELFRSGGTAILRRFQSEREAKKTFSDVLTTSDPAEMAQLADAGAFIAFKPEGLDKVPQTAIDPEGRYFGQRLNTITIYYRSDKIAEKDAPKSMKDLIDPKYKGQMVLSDPAFASMQLAVVGMTAKSLGWDYYEKLRANDTMVVQGGQQVVEMLKRGERLIAVGASDSYASDARAEGRPIKSVYPPDGTFLITSPTAIPVGAPHPNAAKVFAEFLLTKEAQALIPQAGGYAARTDIDPPTGSPPLATVKVQPIDFKYIEKNASKIKNKFNETFQ